MTRCEEFRCEALRVIRSESQREKDSYRQGDRFVFVAWRGVECVSRALKTDEQGGNLIV